MMHADPCICRPGARERFFQNPDKYLNDAFLNTILCQGLRFVWPYNALSAVAISPTNGLLCFTDEFLLRSNNLRSFAISSDFLSKYPEFHGDAQQLEPSPTSYLPDGGARHLETLYWRTLRERIRNDRLLENPKVPQDHAEASATAKCRSTG